MRRRNAFLAAVAALAVAASVVVALAVGADRAARLAGGGTAPAEVVAPEDAAPAPELAGIAGWLNSPPLTMAGLRGRVVLVDFWTYSCVNCRRTLPFLRALHDTYAARGLTVIGVHSPEFDFEKLPDNVARAVRALDVTWPVAEDPDRAAWDAFRNSYWPADYLVDRSGRIRVTHVGEGGDTEIENALRGLLAEGGGDPGEARVGDVQRAPGAQPLTPEQYLGAERGGYLRDGETRDVTDHGGTTVRLTGRFTGGAEYVAAAAPGARVRLAFDAKDVYAVLAPPAGSTARQRVEVRLDGAPVPVARRGRDVREAGGRTYVDVAADDLYHLVTGPARVTGERLDLVATAPGLRWFTFTFGG
ncbi:MAG TPA: redoxin domain-containing protein [Mycobacteriales bacterium]|jgi:thiol-disulfide isomerase/thioredoxin|nr:redoxin domain-containing protein [Mycobacteriales bacterium]